MVVLLVAHDVYHLINGVVIEAHLGGADVLRHVDRRAVRAEQQFLVEALVSEVCPHAAVLLAEEKSLFEAFLHLGLTFQISLRLVVYLVEANAERLVRLVETGVHPRVHLLPKGAHLGVALLPFHEHFVSFLDERSLFLGLLLGLLVGHAVGYVFGLQLLNLFTVVLVKGHVVVAYQVVALLSARLGRLAVAVFQPGQHRLADVYASVVHYVGLHHAVAVGLHYLREAPA